MKTTRRIFGCLLVAFALPCGAGEPTPPLVWQQGATLDGTVDPHAGLGLGGPIAGVHEDRLIIAGGSNFPQGFPWEKPESGHPPPKLYTDAIHVFEKSKDGALEEIKTSTRLPTPLAYAVPVSTPWGILVVGGEYKDPPVDGSQAFHLSKDVFLLTWDKDSASLRIVREIGGKALPPLPEPRSSATGALCGQRVYIATGQGPDGPSDALFCLDLSRDELAWERLENLPASPRILAVSACQSDGLTDAFYVFSGRNPATQPVTLLSDAWRWTGTGWEALPEVTLDGAPRCVMAGSALPIGVNSVAVFGGAEGHVMLEIIQQVEKAKAGDAQADETWRAMQRNHAGFSPEVLVFNTVTHTWSVWCDMPTPPTVTTTAVRWDDEVVIPSGEISPGVRSPDIWVASLKHAHHFGALNFTVLFAYLALMIVNGWIFSRRMKNTDDFFKAGGRIPWWAAGLSIFGTQLSAITFISIPSKVYVSDWRMYVAQISIVLVAPLVVAVFLPFYRRLNVTTAYEYLELRFNAITRWIGSLMFIILQFGRIAIVLYLPAIALSIVTGMSVETCILLMGLLCIVYTAMGGMEAVIWTDVIQVTILLGGAVLALCLMPGSANSDWNTMVTLARDAGKFDLLDFRLSWTESTFLVMLLGGFGVNLIPYGTDQSVIQRYLTTANEKAAAKSIWTNAALALPCSLIFFLIGSMLFATYTLNPAAYDPVISKQDGIFPFYVVTQLGGGIAGLVIAAVFAASMSSLDSSMNSVSAAVTTDFYRKFGKQVTDASALRVARATVVVTGLLGTGFALWMAHSDIKSLWDQFSKIIGLFGGGLGGVFLLGIFSQRANGPGALAGLIGSGFLQFIFQFFVEIHVHPWFLGTIGILSCMVIGQVFSLLIPAAPKTEGLTYRTLEKAGS